MTQPMFALQPRTRLPVQEDRRLASRGKILDPESPKLRKTFGSKDGVQGLPTDCVKNLAEIELEDDSGYFAFMASLYGIGSVDEVLRYC